MKIALLIDADNTSPFKLDAIFELLEQRGDIGVCRAYANWQKEIFKSWDNAIKNHPIDPVHEPDFATGKNASDIALVIDAMDLLHQGAYDTFAIVSSDSDFTRLITRLRLAGCHTIVFGRQHATEPYRNRCDEFVFLEDLSSSLPQEQAMADSARTPTTQQTLRPATTAELPKIDISDKAIDMALCNFIKSHATGDGFVLATQAVQHLRSMYAGYRITFAGHAKFLSFLESHSERYGIRMAGDGAAKELSFCIISEDTASPNPAQNAPAPRVDIPEEYIRRALEAFAELNAEPDGFTYAAPAAAYLASLYPGSKIRYAGERKFRDFLIRYPDHYTLKETPQGFGMRVSYRCL